MLLLVTAAAAAAITASMMAASSSGRDDQCTAVKSATSGRGNLVVPVVNNVTSKQACCALCLKQAGCGGWTWGDTVVHGSCFLRKPNTEWYAQTGAESGEALGPPAPPPFAFSNTLGDHAVLQNPITIWGIGTPGATVTTAVSGGVVTTPAPSPPPAALSTTVGPDGIWRQAIPNLSESLVPVSILSTTGGNRTIALHDVLIGKTILCSGQSNIDTIITKNAFNATAEIAAAGNFPHVRIAGTAHHNAWAGPLTDLPELKLAWTPPTSDNIPGFSATCWFAARDVFIELGGKTAVGVIQSAAGGTAVRNWVPTEGLSHCSQPWSGLQHYGYGPYTQSTLFNGMIHPFGTGPTSFTFVLWDQAESDSYPQTMPGYYGCQTLAHISSWRALLEDPLLPWVFVHLQPYTGSYAPALFNPELYATCSTINGDSLAELRSEQLNALQLPKVGYANAIDLGDPTSPFGNVHFQNKQTIAKRIVSAAMEIAFARPGGSGGAVDYPPPRFLSQLPSSSTGGGCSMTVSFYKPSAVGAKHKKSGGGGKDFSLALGSTPDPGQANRSSAVCPPAATGPPLGNWGGGSDMSGNCSGFELLCVTVTNGAATGAPLWLPATPKLSSDGKTLTLTATGPDAPTRVARGSRYAWAAWPLATLFAAAGPGNEGELGLPILPWKQSLTCTDGKVAGAPC